MAISRKKSNDGVAERMKELMGPIDKQIMMTDDRNDLLMIACAMLHRAKDIFDNELGRRATELIFVRSIVDEDEQS
jgi:hypothetical protein